METCECQNSKSHIKALRPYILKVLPNKVPRYICLSKENRTISQLTISYRKIKAHFLDFYGLISNHKHTSHYKYYLGNHLFGSVNCRSQYILCWHLNVSFALFKNTFDVFTCNYWLTSYLNFECFCSMYRIRASRLDVRAHSSNRIQYESIQFPLNVYKIRDVQMTREKKQCKLSHQIKVTKIILLFVFDFYVFRLWWVRSSRNENIKWMRFNINSFNIFVLSYNHVF